MKRTALAVLATLLSPIAEKNPVKALSGVAPIVLSMSRVTVAVFTYVMAHRLLSVKTAIGWPESTLVVALVFALPVLAALSKVSPQEVVAFGAKILERFGVGDVAQPSPGGNVWADNERDERWDAPHGGRDADGHD